MWGLIFPGQGSQHIGMGQFLYDNFKSAKELFEEASDTLKLDFKKLCFTGHESDLTLTQNTQPALLLVSTAMHRVLHETIDCSFQFTAGHSLGEYSALVAANSIDFKKTLKAVRLRGQFMQEAVPVGAGGMLAVLGLADEEVEKLCDWAQKESGLKPLEPANYNAPSQVVVSGNKELCDWLQTNFDSTKVFGEKKRAKLIPLNVSAPFHCSMMKPAQEQMNTVLREIPFEAPKMPVIQNVSAVDVRDPNVLRRDLVAQISAPVKWAQGVNKMKQLGVTSYLECGPSKVLSGLVKKIDTDARTFNIQGLDDLKQFEAAT
jgi:[acyl-carrier-protein] S-malonyltransferase